MTHPIVEAVAARIHESRNYVGDMIHARGLAGDVVAEVLRLALLSDTADKAAAGPFQVGSAGWRLGIDGWRAGIDALLKEIEG